MKKLSGLSGLIVGLALLLQAQPSQAFFGLYARLQARQPSGACTANFTGGRAVHSWRTSGDNLYLSRTLYWNDGREGSLDASVNRDGSVSGDAQTIVMSTLDCLGITYL